MDDVRKQLREAAEAHQPDREEMLVRIQRGMAHAADADRTRSYRRRRQASWLKVSIASLAGVGVLGLGGLAVAAGVKQLAPQHTVVSGTPNSGVSDATPATSPPATRSATQVPNSSGTPTPRHSAAGVTDGPITARGDVDPHSTIYWEQNNLTVDVTQPLTAMTVELRVALSSGVQSTGSWQTAPPDDFTVSVTQADGFLVYRWTLKPGRTVPAAQQRFAAQFNHGTGKRDASKDTFLVQAATAGRTASVHGGFGAGGG